MGGLAATGITGRALLTCDRPVGRALLTCDRPGTAHWQTAHTPASPFTHTLHHPASISIFHTAIHISIFYAIYTPLYPLRSSFLGLGDAYHPLLLPRRHSFYYPLFTLFTQGEPRGSHLFRRFLLYPSLFKAIPRLYTGYTQAIHRLYTGFTLAIGGYTGVFRGI
jgi:hypothetical protein